MRIFVSNMFKILIYKHYYKTIRHPEIKIVSILITIYYQ